MQITSKPYNQYYPLGGESPVSEVALGASQPFYVGQPGENVPLFQTLQALEAIDPNDLLIVERNGERYRLTADEMQAFLGLPVSINDAFDIKHNL